MIISIMQSIRAKFSPRIDLLRIMVQKYSDPTATEVLAFVGKRFLGNWRYFPFLTGSCSICLAAAWHVIGGLYAVFAKEHYPLLVPYLPTIST